MKNDYADEIEIRTDRGDFVLRLFQDSYGDTVARLIAPGNVPVTVPGEFRDSFDTDTGRAALIKSAQAAAEAFTIWPGCYSDGFDDPASPDYMEYACTFEPNADGDYVCTACGFIAHEGSSGWMSGAFYCRTCGDHCCEMPLAPRR